MQGEVLHITAYQGNDYPCVNISQYGVPGQQQGRSIDIFESTDLNQKLHSTMISSRIASATCNTVIRFEQAWEHYQDSLVVTGFPTNLSALVTHSFRILSQTRRWKLRIDHVYVVILMLTSWRWRNVAGTVRSNIATISTVQSILADSMLISWDLVYNNKLESKYSSP